MPSPTDALEPQALWRHFAALSAIPRASGKEAAARAYVLAQAARLQLEATSDAVGNVVVRKPARPGREAAPPVVLQGHLDMVCEKNEGTVHDFDRDPIQLVREGEWLRAAGTTLGADNGAGVAAGLAVMESDSIAHGPLEFLFTIDEETGLTGAAEFPAGLLRAKYFLNLDNEEEGTLCIGCAGGLNTTATRAVTLEPAPAGNTWRLKVSGLQGGHSGIDIAKGRGNAIRILGRLLETLLGQLPVSVAEIQGGSKRNAIPREASALIVVPAGREGELQALLAATEVAIRAELGSFDPNLRLSCEPGPAAGEVLSAADAEVAAAVLASLHHGVLAMSPDIPGLVQTSTNLATVSTGGSSIEIGSSQRSPIESHKLAAARMVKDVLGFAGFAVKHTGGYPGWKPEPGSELVRLAQAAHQQVFGAPAHLIAMHAGLECGVIGEKYPGMQMISFGPHIVDAHSPTERIKIASVGPFWSLLCTLLEQV